MQTLMTNVYFSFYTKAFKPKVYFGFTQMLKLKVYFGFGANVQLTT